MRWGSRRKARKNLERAVPPRYVEIYITHRPYPILTGTRWHWRIEGTSVHGYSRTRLGAYLTSYRASLLHDPTLRYRYVRR